ncbi:alpha/beta-hydrolase [Piedraia hortae CBS 480.64]|uniref:Alpha/beta-hydrolase n=1 Tax=Piedraia hortae CBS 480.64 TaxID=1314780 RepID=A0A6A7CBZ2_9PEZI|nr:alpha/beta-hydrolase [Piedraia hortae CBS 480.64]
MGQLPVIHNFPANVTLAIGPPPNNEPSTNVLILLHGLGDAHESFAKLGERMKLPATTCISVQGPRTLLDLGGYHWGDDVIFDSSQNGLDADAGFKSATAMIRGLIEDDLIPKHGFMPREIFLFGFGQGGMLALNVAMDLHQRPKTPTESELGGVVSIGGPLPGDVPTQINKCKTPILVCAGRDESSVTPAAEDKLKRNFEFVQIARYRRPRDGMPADRDEMMPIMQFFASRLKSTKGIFSGSVEL